MDVKIEVNNVSEDGAKAVVEALMKVRSLWVTEKAHRIIERMFEDDEYEEKVSNIGKSIVENDKQFEEAVKAASSK